MGADSSAGRPAERQRNRLFISRFKRKINMPSELQTKPNKVAAPRRKNSETEESTQPTSIGWQGIRFVLPPDWNLTGFSMDRENGYLRVDAPGNSTLTVQVRWLNASNPDQNNTITAYTIIAPFVRHWLKRSAPIGPTSKLNLSGNLERILKETEKQAKKAKATFDSTIKPEKTEGKDGERSAIHFSWTGEGRAQGKIWHCKTCDRVVVAQVIGMAKDQSAIANIASRLFATFQDHAIDGYDRWALYDLQMDVPERFPIAGAKTAVRASASGMGAGWGTDRAGSLGTGEHAAEKIFAWRLVPQQRPGFRAKP